MSFGCQLGDNNSFIVSSDSGRRPRYCTTLLDWIYYKTCPRFRVKLKSAVVLFLMNCIKMWYDLRKLWYDLVVSVIQWLILIIGVNVIEKLLPYKQSVREHPFNLKWGRGGGCYVFLFGVEHFVFASCRNIIFSYKNNIF